MKLPKAIVLLLLVPLINAEYYCGKGLITRALSLTTASFCDSHKLSQQCCYPHDNCFADAERHDTTVTHDECDERFRNCIYYHYRDRSICRRWLQFTHCNALSIAAFFRWLF